MLAQHDTTASLKFNIALAVYYAFLLDIIRGVTRLNTSA
jgi:hypothetical protein